MNSQPTSSKHPPAPELRLVGTDSLPEPSPSRLIGESMDVPPRGIAVAPAAGGNSEFERVEHALAELAARTRDLDDVAHIASHDLKEPLRGIFCHAALTLEEAKGTLAPSAAARLQQIQRLAQRSDSLINAMLHIARAGRSWMRALPTDLNQLAAQVIAELEPVLQEKRACVQVEAVLPEVICDPPWIAEVLTQLVVNAVTFNEQEQKLIRISWRADGPRAIIVVEDNGIGIPPRHREAVFHLCKRLHQRDRYGGGIGSGLTLCRRILERHGGTIWLESSETGGTRVLFALVRHLEGANVGR
jgi:two-component system, chemotaxis family, sensor kinase Cph1